ncbi:MAG: hypothetical protein JSV50_12115, partial [Desulfobacteraceae bacterium]
NAPLALYKGMEQAEKATAAKESALWGCPGLNFRANLPFDGIMQFFAALLKEIPTALFVCQRTDTTRRHYFQSAKLVLFF